jgi:hypothetical protein
MTFAAGCTAEESMVSDRPRPTWPGQEPARPTPMASSIYRPPTAPMTPAQAQAPSIPEPAPAPSPVTGLSIQPRRAWSPARATAGKLNPMAGGVRRITVHHEGHTPVYFSDGASTAERLRQIQSAHMNQRGWGDIGYHYVIDRSGRIWEARPIQYQGAHVASNNENNLGIMVLGNFDKQQPTDAQMATLRQALIRFRKTYNVPVSRVYTHQEITPTACPGRSLQPRMVAMRKGNQLA